MGSAVDPGILWLGQRQDGLAWEYVAIVNTVEGMGGLILAAGLAYAAIHIRDGESLAPLRLLGGSLMVVGIVGGVLGLMLITDYFALRTNMEQQAEVLFRTTTVKGLTLSGLYFFVLVPVGFLGLVRRKP